LPAAIITAAVRSDTWNPPWFLGSEDIIPENELSY